MSIISNRHTIVKLDKDSKALSGQFLARVIAKQNKDGTYHPNLTESKCVSIPVIQLTSEQLTAFMPHVVKMCQDAQESIIRDAIIMNNITEVSDDDISVSAILAYLEDGGSKRITREYLQQWFTESYGEQAASFVVNGLKYDPASLTADQEKRVTQSMNILRDLFAGWSGGKYAPNKPQCNAMIKFIDSLGEAVCDRMSAMKNKCIKRIEVIDSESSLDALGFTA